MLITLFRRIVICQSVTEVYLTGVTPLGAVSHRFIFLLHVFIVNRVARNGQTFFHNYLWDCGMIGEHVHEAVK